jgi:hypothetical protein
LVLLWSGNYSGGRVIAGFPDISERGPA